MSNVDMCHHDWPGTGCRECMREAHKVKVSKLEDRLLDEIESKMLAEAELHNAAELSLKAEARIEELEEMLKWYVEEDEIHEGDPDNQYWIDGKHKAMKLLGMEIEE